MFCWHNGHECIISAFKNESWKNSTYQKLLHIITYPKITLVLYWVLRPSFSYTFKFLHRKWELITPSQGTICFSFKLCLRTRAKPCLILAIYSAVAYCTIWLSAICGIMERYKYILRISLSPKTKFNLTPTTLSWNKILIVFAVVEAQISVYRSQISAVNLHIFKILLLLIWGEI